jgi:hypothetical protein
MSVEHVSRLFEFEHTAMPKRIAKAICCECVTCFLSHEVCQKSVMFDPVLCYDPGWCFDSLVEIFRLRLFG